jgi:deoxyribonuclease V
MHSHVPHPWNVSPEEAVAIQRTLAAQVIRTNQFKQIRAVAGVDLSFPEPDRAHAAVVVLDFPSLKPVSYVTADLPVTFPYVPGLLAFRESPAALAAFAKLNVDVDLIMVDGAGIAHPRRMGIACHLGLYLDRPAIGCAKSRLTGSFTMPGAEAGSQSGLTYRGELIGTVLRTRTNVSPLFVSLGHRIDQPTSVAYVLRCCKGLRLPEPTRLAHNLAAGRVPEISAQNRLPL